MAETSLWQEGGKRLAVMDHVTVMSSPDMEELISSQESRLSIEVNQEAFRDLLHRAGEYEQAGEKPPLKVVLLAGPDEVMLRRQNPGGYARPIRDSSDSSRIIERQIAILMFRDEDCQLEYLDTGKKVNLLFYDQNRANSLLSHELKHGTDYLDKETMRKQLVYRRREGTRFTATEAAAFAVVTAGLAYVSSKNILGPSTRRLISKNTGRSLLQLLTPKTRYHSPLEIRAREFVDALKADNALPDALQLHLDGKRIKSYNLEVEI